MSRNPALKIGTQRKMEILLFSFTMLEDLSDECLSLSESADEKDSVDLAKEFLNSAKNCLVARFTTRLNRELELSKSNPKN
jgi:hypothetical protein